jgi:purine nucleosidase
MAPRRIIIDTDPGQDDAVALLLALASPEELDVVGVAAVAGNVPLDKTAYNARRIVELAGRTGVPVHAGCERPLARNLVTAEHVHGRSGLDGYDLPEPVLALADRHGVDFIVDALMAAEAGEITLCTLGPLTNVATALAREPAIAPRVREVVMMGGAYFEVGNITPTAEFNIHADPEAADAVFRSGIPITMASLDVTHQVLTTHERLAAFAGLGNRVGAAVAGLLSFSERFDLEKYGGHGAPLHDPCVIAWLIRPELFRGRTVNVSVELTGELTAGMTVVDYWRITDRPKNVHFLRHVDADGFYALLLDRLARLP